ncbi:MAG TPA: carboxypeptidase regulatory-like domain-containing protein [Patescibacteria group bacterium]|nr:carboxypeptidase regulatory-like domain-containing protein [Patescibacteria group bacterium]
MKKLLTLCLAVAVLSVLAFGQQSSTADIYGTVVLPDGSSIPGVAVTISGDVGATKTAVTSEEGNFRFVGLPPGNYELKFELEGFKTVIRKGIRMYVGKNLTLTVPMETTTIKEEIVVTAQANILDTRKTSVGINISKEDINRLPQARNPWSIINLIPGMMVDREDVGGNESGQQSGFYGQGGVSNDVAWNIDGSNVTDVSAFGAPAYLDPNAYDEIQVSLASNDITAQTGGVQLNFVSKKGGNKFSGDFHLYAEDERWQLNPKAKEGLPSSYTSPGVLRLYQYGLNLGGPIIKDKLFFAGSWSIQDIHAKTTSGLEDTTLLNSAYAKLTANLGNTQADFTMHNNNKQKWNRTDWGSEFQEVGTLWRQSGPGYTWMGSLQQTLGNLLLSAKYNHTTNPFNLHPNSSTFDSANRMVVGPEMTFSFDNPAGFYASGGYLWQDINRITDNFILDGNLFVENKLGGDHEIRFGVDYFSNHTMTDQYYTNMRGVLYTSQFNDIAPVEGFTWPDTVLIATNGPRDTTTFRMSGYLSDTISFNKLVVSLGLRYDSEWGSLNAKNVKGFTLDGATIPALEPFVGARDLPAMDSPAKWQTFAPRLSFTYDIGGDGKNVLKLSAARYSQPAGTILATFIWNAGSHFMRLPWSDANHDGSPQLNEITVLTPQQIIDMQNANPETWGGDWPVQPYDPLYSFYGGYYPIITFQGFDYTDPNNTQSSNRFDPDFKSPLMTELILQYEHALSDDMAVSIQGIYKKSTNIQRNLSIWSDGTLESKADWTLAGIDPVTQGEAWSRNRFDQIGLYRTNFKERYRQYMALQLLFTKKLTSKWMGDLSFTYADWSDNLSRDEELDLTNFDYFNKGAYAPAAGGSGMTGVLTNSRWMVKLSALYKLPFGFDISTSFAAREGYPVKLFDARYAGKNMMTQGKKLGDDRLPTLWTLNLSLQREIRFSEGTRAVLHVDGMNITNNNTTLNMVATLGSANRGNPTRILNPGLFMFGVNLYF